MQGFYQDLELNIYDDSQDLLLYEDQLEKFVVLRKESQSCMFAKLFNDFGRMKGFEQIMTLMNIENQSLDFMAQILPALANIHVLFFRQFAVRFIKQLQQIVFKQVLDSSENNLRNLSKESLENIIQALIKLQRRNNDRNKHEHLERFFLKTAMMFINSQFLEKQVFGLKHLIELMSQLKNRNYKYLTTEIISAKIQKHQIFAKIFGVDSHTQLIEKSSDFLRFFFREDIIDNGKLDVLLDSSKTNVS